MVGLLYSVIVWLVTPTIRFPLMSVTAPASMSSCGVAYPLTFEMSLAPNVRVTVSLEYAAPESETLLLLFPVSCMWILEPLTANNFSLNVIDTVPLCSKYLALLKVGLTDSYIMMGFFTVSSVCPPEL